MEKENSSFDGWNVLYFGGIRKRREHRKRAVFLISVKCSFLGIASKWTLAPRLLGYGW